MHKVEMPLTKILTASYKEKFVDFFSFPPLYYPHYHPITHLLHIVLRLFIINITTKNIILCDTMK